MLHETVKSSVLFDGRFLNKPSFGISRDSMACLSVLNSMGVIGGFLSLIDSSAHKTLIVEKKNIGPSKTHKRLIIRSLLLRKIKLDINLNTNVFFQSQVDSVKYQFTTPHQRILRIHDMFPITNSEWFTKRTSYLFRKGVLNIESNSKIFVNSISTYEAFQSIVNCDEKNLSIFLVPCYSRRPISNFCKVCSFCLNQYQISQTYLLCVGTIDLIKAWENSKNKRIYDKLIIVGRIGWNSTEIIKSIRKSKDVFHIVDCCDAGLTEIYKHAKAFITASIDEGYNIPLDEADDMGLKLIISDISVHRERFNKNGSNWFNPKIIEDIEVALCNDPKLTITQVHNRHNFNEVFINAYAKAINLDQ